jgi:vacuolar protein sorting-associated protein 13B
LKAVTELKFTAFTKKKYFHYSYVKDEASNMRRDDTWQSRFDINSNYQKTFALKSKSKALNVNFYSRGVSFTMYKDTGRQRVEMITLNLDDIGVKYSKLSRNLKINFSKVQVDNELFPSGEYDFPVVLCNKELPKTLGHQVASTSIWDLSEIIDEQSNQEMFSIDLDLYEKNGIENVCVKLQPIRVYIEDTFINFLLGMVDDCLPMNLVAKTGKDNLRVKLENGLVLVPMAVLNQAQILADPLRLKTIRLEPLHVLLSVHTCMR